MKTKEAVTDYLLGRIKELESANKSLLADNNRLDRAIRENPPKELAIVEMQEREVIFNTISTVTEVITEIGLEWPEAVPGLKEIVAAINQRFDI